MKKMLGKKDKSEDPMKKEAKLNAIKEMRSMASEMMGEDLKSGLTPKAKVTVAADSPEGLKEGLEKAEDVMEDMDLDEMAHSEDEDETPALEEIEEMERELAAMKAKLNG